MADNSMNVHANSRVLQIGEKTYKMDFDMQALSLAEQIYTSEFNRDVNVAQIVTDLFEVKMTACMAFAYSALISAGEVITWREFSKKIFTFENFENVFGVVSDAIKALFRVTGAKEDTPEGDAKN